MTNADVIRKMDDLELAEFLERFMDYALNRFMHGLFPIEGYEILFQLRQEYEGE